MCNKEIETDKNDVKIGDNGLNWNAASARTVTRLQETGSVLLRYSCMHDHAVLWHSLFWFGVFIAIRRFAAGIQINPGLPGPLGHARHPMLSAIHHMSMACLRLHHLCQASAGYLAGMGAGTNTPSQHLPAPDCTRAFSSSWSRARTCPIQRVFS